MQASFNSHSNFAKATSVLVVLVIAFAAALIGVIAYMMNASFAVEQLRKDITAAQREGVELHIKLSEAASLEYVLERSQGLSYIEIESVSYVKKPTSSSVASR
ncbi:MAG: hypothetical protein WD850_00185 [Candidatus Spechtbacterales bacterium]